MSLLDSDMFVLFYTSISPFDYVRGAMKLKFQKEPIQQCRMTIACC
jgi:hypothetical protein